MLEQPQCHKRGCRNYRGAQNDGDETTERNFCRAFPDKIPDEIAYGSNLHLNPVKGDHGIQFERGD
jgi:hypothetical protein